MKDIQHDGPGGYGQLFSDDDKERRRRIPSTATQPTGSMYKRVPSQENLEVETPKAIKLDGEWWPKSCIRDSHGVWYAEEWLIEKKVADAATVEDEDDDPFADLLG